MANVLRGTATLIMVGLIGAVALTGRWPVDAPRTHEGGHGILSIPPGRVERVAISVGDTRTLFSRRPGGGWLVNSAAVEPTVAEHIDTALRLLNNSAPRRTLAPGEYDARQAGEYGLNPPRFVVAVVETGGTTTRIGFGAATPALNAQYADILGGPDRYLLRRDVGEEWKLALDMAERAASVSAGLLLPVSIAQLWAIEIVTHGTLYRFERDPSGDWFHHVGQHVHAQGGLVHRADPQLAPLIAGELAALEQSQVGQVVARNPDAATLGGAGLEHPPIILLMYSRDTAGPVARIELGKVATDGTAHYARVPPSDLLVTVPDDTERHIGRLVDLAGTSP